MEDHRGSDAVMEEECDGEDRWGFLAPAPFPECRAVLRLLGGHLRVAGDDADSPHTLGAQDGRDLAAAQRKLMALWERCSTLRKGGLCGHAIVGLLRAYAWPVSHYPLRLGAATLDTVQAYDEELKRVWGVLLGGFPPWGGHERAYPPSAVWGCNWRWAEWLRRNGRAGRQRSRWRTGYCPETQWMRS